MTAAPPTTLADWLLVRIAEDEERAEYRHDDDCLLVQFPDRAGCSCARTDRRRALAECEAKRRIVALHEVTPSYVSGAYGCVICAENDRLIEPEGFCDTVKLLALPYADAPGFREEWRP